MARIKTSGVISDIRGKIQGSVFQGYKGGIFVRSSSSPINKRSFTQLQARSFTKYLQSQWLGLTAVQRQQWDIWATFRHLSQKNNIGKYVNGQQAFLKINHYRLQYDYAIITTPSFDDASPDNVTWSLDNNAGTLVATPSRVFDYPSEYGILSLSRTMNNSINNGGSEPRLIKYQTDYLTSYDVTTLYEAIYGTIPSIGDTIFIKSSVQNNGNGLLSLWNRQKVIVGGYSLATFGSTATGISALLNTGNEIFIVPATPATSGKLKKITVYIKQYFGTPGFKMKCALYTNSWTLVAGSESDEMNVPTSVQWVECPVSGLPSITGGNQYWLAVWSNGGSEDLYANVGTMDIYYKPLTYGAWPASIVTATKISGYIPSIYGTLQVT